MAFKLLCLSIMCLIVIMPWQNGAHAVADNNAISHITTAIDTTNGIISTQLAGAASNSEPGEIIVKFKNLETAQDALRGNETGHGTVKMLNSAKLTEVLERFEVGRAERVFKNAPALSLQRTVKFSQSISAPGKDKHGRALISELAAQPEVEYAEPNVIMTAQAVPNDPFYSSTGSWGQPFRDLWGLQNISAEGAWNISTGSGTVVAVSDTGIDYNHPDLTANLWINPGETGKDSKNKDKSTNGIDDDGNGFVDDWRGWNFVTNTNDPFDDFGHGTHVAGTIAAVGNNNIGIIGVAPSARIMGVKGLDANGSGFLDVLANTLVYAANNGAGVINASWGGFGQTPQTLIDAVNYAHDVKGVVVVAAAGNNGVDVGSQGSGFFPANIRNAVTVSAFDHTDTKASFSNFGSKIDVGAPGGGDAGVGFDPFRSVLSLLSSGAVSAMTGNGNLIVGTNYLRQAGTSMAAPHAAGVAALVRSLHPAWGPEEVRQALRSGSNDVGAPGFDVQSGYGRLNALGALSATSTLAVELTGPTTQAIFGDQVDVTGTASGTNFASWILEYGDGDTPASWTPIAAGTSPVNRGLLAAWNLTTVSEGRKTLHLVAQNVSGAKFEDRLSVTVDQVSIDSPQTTFLGSMPIFTIRRAGEAVAITGTVSPANFSNYTIRIFDGNGVELTNPALTLANGGLQKVVYGLLGTWDTTGIAQGEYEIVLQANLSAGAPIVERTKIGIDPSLHPGWPQPLGLVGGAFSFAITDHVDVADIDQNGTNDIIVGYGGSVRILDHTGAMLPGWPQSVDPGNLGLIEQKSPAVGDLDGDGSPEIVAANNNGQIFVWKANGVALAGWPKTILAGTPNSIAIADVNGDGTNEIIAADWFGIVNVLDKNGVNIAGWPRTLGGGILSPTAVADMDGDGKKEIVVINLTPPSNLHILSFDGNEMPGWPKPINANMPANQIFFSYPALGDLNSDGKLDAVVGAGDGTIYAYNLDGTAVAGWPQSTKAAAVNSPAIGDIDGDGRAEVVAGISTIVEDFALVNYLYAWHGNGAPLPGWPLKNDRPISETFFGFGAPAIADVDGDAVADVIVSGDWTEPFSVSAFHGDGTKAAGFPKIGQTLGAFNTNTTAVADIDGDGLLEMVWIDFNSNLYVWDLPTLATTAALPWPMFARDAQHTTQNPQNGFPDAHPPTVTLTAPSADLAVFGTTTVSASAIDDTGVAGVQFKLDGTNLGAEDSSFPYSINWNTTGVTDGTHVLSAAARDADGNIGTSQAVNVRVSNHSPAVNIGSPPNGSTIPAKGKVTITVNAAAANGISQINIWVDLKSVQICKKVTTCVASWNVNNVSAGNHTITASALDNTAPTPILGNARITVLK
jgi:subtilisin family serine protease